MSRRIDIELTSARPDGTWTWRAAGARQPKGSLDGTLVPAGSKAGDVLRAEADFEIDGITILSLAPPKARHQAEPERLELIARPAPEAGVTTQLAGRSGARRRDHDDRRRGEGRGAGERGPGRREGRSNDGGGERRGPRPGAQPGDRAGGARTAREHLPAPRERAASGEGPRRARPAGAPGGRTVQAAPRVRAGAEQSGRARPRRLNPGNTYRTAALAALSPEQQPIAEQVLRGGIPAVRTAIHLERERAAAEGRAAPNAEALLAMAESMLPKLKAAEWRDRADAAVKAPTGISLRDLRSVVAGADVARDEESRALAATLRSALEDRVAALRTEWTGEIIHHLDEGRSVRALRLSGRPPEPSTRLPEDVAARLAEAAGAAMAPDAPADRWIALVEAVAASPVRRSVQPAGMPEPPSAELLRAAHQQAARIPALVAMLGIAIPPPPSPARRPAPPSQGRQPARPAPPGPEAAAAAPPPKPAPPDPPAEPPADPASPGGTPAG